MKKPWIFEHLDYRKTVQAKLKAEGHTRGYRTELAKAAGCQLAYVSHVLAGQAHFTPDQAAGLVEFWNLDELEAEYFLNLVHIGRAASPRLIQRLQKRQAQIRQAHSATKRSRLTPEPHDREKVLEYYLDWAVAAVHAALTIPALRDPVALAERLNLSEARVRRILSLLQDLGFAQKKDASWTATTNFFHAADENLFAHLHHCNWRRRVEEDLQRTSKTESLHYTAIHSLSQDDLKRIRKMVEEFISQTRKIVAPSPEETLACFTLDWFELKQS